MAAVDGGDITLAIIGLLVAIATASVPAWLNYLGSRKQAKDKQRLAEDRDRMIAEIREQVIPNNGTRLSEYVERIDEKLTRVAQDSAEARLSATNSEWEWKNHLSSYHHDRRLADEDFYERPDS